MIKPDQLSLAHRFRAQNLAGGLVLPNAWDVASARIFEAAGFPAIATTSGGIAYARGLPDAQRIDRKTMVQAIAAIANAVAVPVSADIESGYGISSNAVVDTVAAVMDVGVVGVNLEDNSHGNLDTALFGIAEQAQRIAAARTCAEQRGIPLTINARTDTFLLGLGDSPEQRLAMTIERARAYLEAGADLVFVPALVDTAIIERLVAEVRGPISLMAMPGAPDAKTLLATGAKRVSLGVAPMLAIMGAVRDIAAEVRDHGTWSMIERSFYGFAEAERLFAAT